MKKIKFIAFALLIISTFASELLMHNTIPFFYFIVGLLGAILLIGTAKFIGTVILKRGEDFYE